MFSFIVVIWSISLMIIMYVLLRICIWGSKFSQTRGPWSVHELPWVLLSELWLSYYALVFVCLIQLLIYMLCMKQNVPRLSHWKVKVNFMYNKGLFNSKFKLCISSGGSYHIQQKNFYKCTSPFSSMPLVHIHLFLFINLSYMGGLIS